MRLLGIDPGLSRTGFGIVDADGATLVAVDFGVITPGADHALPARLAEIFADLTTLMETHHPDEVAVEETFYGLNVQSALKLGQAKGVALLAASRMNIPVFEYAPRKVKMATTGRGNAAKEQVQFMVTRRLNLPAPPEPLDASDALAVAICHHQQQQFGPQP